MTQSNKTSKRVIKVSGSKSKPRITRVATPVYDRHIEVSLDVRGGKPRIAGRRIAVEDIVAMHLFHGQTIQYIIDNYKLAPVQVYAALTYYYDHRAQIDQSLANGVAQYEHDKAARISLVEQKQAALAAS
jgi:uncharacterized protein (DUF433 family)